MSVEAQRDNYVRGLITIEEFETRIEPALLREAGPQAAVPVGWEPLPPCDHDWIDITPIGSAALRNICASCGERA